MKILDEELREDNSNLDDDDTVEELGLDDDIDDRLVTDYLEDPDEDEDEDELARRKSAYSELKKDDKIFNNSFNMGTAVDEHSEHRGRNQIKVDPGSAEYNYYDRDKHSEAMDDSITSFDINSFVSTSPMIKTILQSPNDGAKKKFTKIEINQIFDEIRKGVTEGTNSSAFVNSIHILDAISALTSLEYKKLFDMLTYENKEILLIELDKKYHFLDRAPSDFKMYE